MELTIQSPKSASVFRKAVARLEFGWSRRALRLSAITLFSTRHGVRSIILWLQKMETLELGRLICWSSLQGSALNKNAVS